MPFILAATALVVSAIAVLAWHFLFSPKAVEAARRRFISNSLRNHSFEELRKNHDEDININGRIFPAHWWSRPCKTEKGIVVEFDVHPSRVPFSVSASDFLFIRDEVHLRSIKTALTASEDYGGYLATDKQVEGICAP